MYSYKIRMKTFILIVVLVLLFDFIWLSLNKNMYNRLVNKVQGSNIKLNFIGAALAYICAIIALFMFAFPLMRIEYEKNKNQSLILLSIKYGGLLGLIMFGIFNTTNIAIFKDYNPNIAIVDILWGFTSYSIISYIYIYSNISSIS
jgi:uncharacterized membrane protein